MNKDDKITSLSDYIKRIQNIREDTLSDGNDQLFFRGHWDKNWSLLPSLFRFNFQSVENKMISQAKLFNPQEFKNELFVVEILAKLQHYGLPTRLLDVTTNPLVALYFACLEPEFRKSELETFKDRFFQLEQTVSKYKSKIPKIQIESIMQNISLEDPDGAVYFKTCYPYPYDEKEVRISSLLANLNLTKPYKMNDLYKENLIQQYYPNYLDFKKNIIKILQDNYCFFAPSNNDRLIRQSGAFILANCYTVEEDKGDFGEFIIKKTKADLANEFSSDVIIIDAQHKNDILAELNQHNINIASLFPELDKKMDYLKRIFYSKDSLPASDFNASCQIPKERLSIIDSHESTCNESDETTIMSGEVLENKVDDPVESHFDYSDKITNESILECITSVIKLNDLSHEVLIKQIKKVMLLLDWYNKDSALAKIRLAIKKYAKSNKFDVSDEIIEDLINKLKGIGAPSHHSSFESL